MKRLAILMIGLVFSLSACADTSTIGASGGAAGIQGKVLLGPMCPVQQAGSPCPDKPIKADIAVTASEGKTVASGRSDESGTYRISLPPGARCPLDRISEPVKGAHPQLRDRSRLFGAYFVGRSCTCWSFWPGFGYSCPSQPGPHKQLL